MAVFSGWPNEHNTSCAIDGIVVDLTLFVIQLTFTKPAFMPMDKNFDTMSDSLFFTRTKLQRYGYSLTPDGFGLPYTDCIWGPHH
jgi:hypothetical protein